MKILKCFAIICLLLSISCGKSTSSNEDFDSNINNKKEKTQKNSSKSSSKIGPIKKTTEVQNGVELTYEIKEMKLHKDASVISFDDMDKVVSKTEDLSSYTFSKKAKGVTKLKQGQVVVFAGETVGRVVFIEENKGKTTVNLGPATLNEAFENLDVEYEAKVNWKKLEKTAYFPSQPKVAYAGFAGGNSTIFEDNFKFSHGGYDMEMKLSPKVGSKLEYEVKILKKGKAKMGAVQVGVEANGNIENYVNKSKMKIYNSSLKAFEYQEDMKGEMVLKFTGVGPGSEIMKLEPEATLVSIPLRIGIIPVIIDLKIKLELRPILSSGGSSKADYKVTFDTAGQGAKLSAGEIKPIKGPKKDVKMKVNGETVSAGTVSTGFGCGINFPIIEVGLFGKTVVPEFYFNFDCSTFYEPGIKSATTPCQSGKTTSQAVAGVKLSFLGLEKETVGFIWKEEKTYGGECK